MLRFNITSALAAVIGGLINGISAQTCDLPTDDAGVAIPIYNQQDMDTISLSCTTLEGDIVIGFNYTGTFILPGVSNITGSIELQPRPSNNIWNYNITSIQLQDLVSVKGFYIPTSDRSAISISLPALTTINTLSIYGNENLALSTPLLRNTAEISLNGTFKRRMISSSTGRSQSTDASYSFDLSQLETVSEQLQISLNQDYSPAVSLPFPYLRNAGSLSLDGPISSISMPVLAAASGRISFTAAYRHAIKIEFPQLSSVGGDLEFQGFFSSFSLPALQNMTGNIQLYSQSDLAVNFTSLEGANDISLGGFISSAAFPVLKYVHDIQIVSSLALDCGPMQQAEAQVSKTDPYTGTFSCSTTAQSDKSTNDHGLTRADSIRVGVRIGGLSLVVALLLN